LIEPRSRAHGWPEPKNRGILAGQGANDMKAIYMALWLVAGISSACSLGRMDPRSWLTEERRSRVSEVAETYAADLRWGRIEQAASHVAPASRAAFLDLFENDANSLRFTHFEVGDVDLGEEHDSARVTVQYRFYRPPALREEHVVERQVWHYVSKQSTWYLDPQLDLFRARPGGKTPSH